MADCRQCHTLASQWAAAGGPQTDAARNFSFRARDGDRPVHRL